MAFDFIQKLIIWLVPLVFAITVHEVAHGWLANKFGDPTAKMLGRITLNPLKHIDLFGTVIIPIALLLLSGGRFTFGYAKPVPVNFGNLRHPRRDMALVALAGPVSNFIMALLWGIVAKIGLSLGAGTSTVGTVLLAFGVAGVQINLVLGILNLIPIPPLDGSRVVTSLLSPKAAIGYNSLERYGFIILILLIVTGILGKILWPLISLGAALIFGIMGIH